MLNGLLGVNARPLLAPSPIECVSRLPSMVVDGGGGLDGIRERLQIARMQGTIPGPVPTPALSVANGLLLVASALPGSLRNWLVLGGGIGFEEGAAASGLRLLDTDADVLRFVRCMVLRSGAMPIPRSCGIASMLKPDEALHQ